MHCKFSYKLLLKKIRRKRKKIKKREKRKLEKRKKPILKNGKKRKMKNDEWNLKRKQSKAKSMKVELQLLKEPERESKHLEG